MQKYAEPLDGWNFEKLFAQEANKDLLIDFIRCLFPEKNIVQAEYLPAYADFLNASIPRMEATVYELMREFRIDVLCTEENGSKCIIEILNDLQSKRKAAAADHFAKFYSRHMHKGGKCADVKEAILVAIADDVVLFPDSESYISVHDMQDISGKKTSKELSNCKFVCIELDKYQSTDQQPTGIDEWCDLLKYATARKKVKTSNPSIEKAYDILELTQWSEGEVFMYNSYLKKLLDRQAQLEYAHMVGYAQGRGEVLKEACDEVRADEKMTENERERMVRVMVEGAVRDMKKEKFPLDLIAKATGLSENEIKKIE